ncbi:MAG: hypothetical protein PUD36_02015 [Bacteroidales bacterium]|nr:hypothetical protein [Bacteroidales bacterium]
MKTTNQLLDDIRSVIATKGSNTTVCDILSLVDNYAIDSCGGVCRITLWENQIQGLRCIELHLNNLFSSPNTTIPYLKVEFDLSVEGSALPGWNEGYNGKAKVTMGHTDQGATYIEFNLI